MQKPEPTIRDIRTMNLRGGSVNSQTRQLDGREVTGPQEAPVDTPGGMEQVEVRHLEYWPRLESIHHEAVRKNVSIEGLPVETD